MPPIIRIENLHYTYQREGRAVSALRGIDLTIEQGEYVVLLGHNGSGKSTLAKHLNALLLPTTGDVWVKAWNTKTRAHLRDIRSTVGMVFQHPDNQIVATIVEEDVAFGPENLGVPRPEILRRVDWALDSVEMQQYRQRAAHQLSGGQKQRICIAGVLAMQPDVLVLDEATAMLDPVGRAEVLAIARRLNREQGVTIVAVTHFMREAVDADRVVILDQGRVALTGPPRTIFQQVERLRSLHLDAPHVSELAIALHRQFPAFPSSLLTPAEVANAVISYCEAGTGEALRPDGEKAQNATNNLQSPNLQSPNLQSPNLSISQSPNLSLSLNHVAYWYMRGTPLEVQAVSDITLEVRRGEIVGLIGHTGSGKSTAIQHLNGLLRPHAGKAIILGTDLNAPEADLRALRRRVGLVFQLPEAQLFEQFVGDDVAYGPRKLGLSREDVRARVRQAMDMVGLPFEEFKDRLTFTLSGGQMRRAALAGVLALQPEVLVLDEPTAGLDPEARRQLMRHILALHDQGMTLVIVSHNMEELAEICDRLYVISDGRSIMTGTPGQVFNRAAELRALGLDAPDVSLIADRLKAAGWLPPGIEIYKLPQAVAAISAVLAAL
ncbi:MAG TPA: energy-coupling factor transporter ATPase, partial [Chloroflexi bacterium]|nr:energy-coupling factor transporter ATPase [Chloroflexota bacterium]